MRARAQVRRLAQIGEGALLCPSTKNARYVISRVFMCTPAPTRSSPPLSLGNRVFDDVVQKRKNLSGIACDLEFVQKIRDRQNVQLH
jgi:hypothetical protein